jgi:spore maturation protein CgeB
MRIAYIARFKKMWDEEYIARSFEALGHTVGKIDEGTKPVHIINDINSFKPDLVIFAKFNQPHAEYIINECKRNRIKTVSWVFDLYWNYPRQGELKHPNFKADYVFTTDGGSNDWKSLGINHNCVRQGIYEPECVMLDDVKEYDVVFVGSHNPSNKNRIETHEKLKRDFKFHWFGKRDDEVRGMKLNRLYAKSKVIVGDSVYSPHYWSNRVVETLGRGGFLIHKEVEGLKEEYPYLVTYKDYGDLKSKISYYLEHNEERNDIIKKNYEWVKNNYTCIHQCKKLLNYIK